MEQRLRWWRRGLRNCCLEKTCLDLVKVYVQLWQFQTPLPIYAVCELWCNFEKIESFESDENWCVWLISILIMFCKNVASVFGQLWRLEPVAVDKKEMWRREMDWILSVTDHIVELIPSWQTLPDGSKLEVCIWWTCCFYSDLMLRIWNAFK